MKALETLFDLLFPPHCPFCGAIQDHPGICPKCADKLPRAEGKDGLREGAGYGKCAFAVYYEGDVRESLLHFKFGGKASWADIYARELLVPAVVEHLSGEFDCLTWVPVSRRRLRRRGYDQARLLAQAAGRIWETPPVQLLRKRRNNPAQSGLQDAAARRANVLGVYEAVDPGQIAGRRVLLIDDILTTGSTLAECCRVLRAAGAAEVVCATVAGSRPRKEGKPDEI